MCIRDRSEDAGMIDAARAGALHLDKLEAMTCVCSVGLDMIALPGDTPAETISAIIADEMAIGMVNCKTTAVRVIPVPGKTVGDEVSFGGLLGTAPIMAYNTLSLIHISPWLWAREIRKICCAIRINTAVCCATIRIMSKTSWRKCARPGKSISILSRKSVAASAGKTGIWAKWPWS